MTALKTFRMKYGRLLSATAISLFILTGVSLILRFNDSEEFFNPLEIDDFVFDSDLLGVAMQQLFVPLTGLLILSLTPFFQNVIISKQPSKKDRSRLFGTLLLILIINLLATVWLNEDIDLGLTNGLLIVLVAAILGGWHIGLLFSLTATIFFIINHFILDQGIESLDHILIVINLAFSDLSVLVMIVSSVLIGVWSKISPQDLLIPNRLFLLGFLIEWISAWFFLLAYGDVDVLIEGLPGALLIGLALLLFGLLIQQVHGRETERRLTIAQTAQTQAELKALRAQINPHFLFNALSTIRYHARTKPETAYDLLDNLSDVFHSVLRSDATITLDEELDTVKAYLAIEKARLGERLSINWQIDSMINRELPIPTLSIQPLVENAIVHGIAPNAQGGTLTISARQEVGYAQISIKDDGCGFKPHAPEVTGHGIGLTNILQRMEAIYGAQYVPMIQSSPGKGTTITLKIPV